MFGGLLTLQGLFNSKPFGASGLSVCPLAKPVNRRSRSITRFEISTWDEVIGEVSYFARGRQLRSKSTFEHSTYLIPCINATPCPLASVLHVSEPPNGRCAEREHLRRTG